MARVEGKGRIALSGGLIVFASQRRLHSPQLVQSKNQLRDSSGRFGDAEERKPLLAQLLERSGHKGGAS